MEFYTLSSGSGGNAALVREHNTVLLIDAGISERRIAQELASIGIALSELSAILITHEHVDHIRGLQTLCKKCPAPVYASRGTAQSLFYAGDALRMFESGETFTVGAFESRFHSQCGIPRDQLRRETRRMSGSQMHQR